MLLRCLRWSVAKGRTQLHDKATAQHFADYISDDQIKLKAHRKLGTLQQAFAIASSIG